MKAQKIVLILAAFTLAATSARATIFWARPYDPNLQRWITRDPIGELGGINLNTYVGNDPVNEIDPLGLLTAVIVGGQASRPGEMPNPFGHIAIATTANGVYSFGTRPEDLGGNLTDYLNWQATYRDSIVYVLNTTPDQERAINDYLKTQKGKPIDRYSDNCAARTKRALEAAGIGDFTQPVIGLAGVGTGATVPIPNLPLAIANALYDPGILLIRLPRGTTLAPNFLTGFNPKK
jgi:hypothetical protein